MDDLKNATDGPQDGKSSSALQISRSIRCKKCSYDLKGLWTPGRCPECGEPIETTLRVALPGGTNQEALDEFGRALRFNGFSWVTAMIIYLPCPCTTLAWGFGGQSAGWVLTPQIFFLMLISFGRLLNLAPLRSGNVFIRQGLPGNIWFLVGASLLTCLIAIMSMIIGPGLISLILILCIMIEGLIWSLFVSRTADALECPYASPLGRIGMALWCGALLLGVLAVIVTLSTVGAGNNELETERAVLFVVTWGVCLASSLLSGLFSIGLADVLPQLIVAEEEDDLLQPVVPQSRTSPSESPGSAGPIELADATDTIIRIRDDDGVQRPESPPESSDTDNRPDVY